jgi:hypothetical protein
VSHRSEQPPLFRSKAFAIKDAIILSLREADFQSHPHDLDTFSTVDADMAELIGKELIEAAESLRSRQQKEKQ